MDNVIRTIDIDKCYICDGNGNYLYKDLRDRVHGVEGVWNIIKCDNPSCKLLWLNPKPSMDSIHLLYKDYYTHHTVKEKRPKDFEVILDFPFKIIYSLLKRILFIRYERKRLNHMYLGKNGGRLLEIGCGNGERLSWLRSKGWDVEGVEIDRKAIKIATHKFNLRIYYGDLISLNLEPQIYNAIIMNHVIEHLYEPLEILKECYRLLKLDGTLVITTPNTQSLGHITFKESWMGLDPPRHLYLFNHYNLKMLVEKAGFKIIKIFTSSAKAESFARGSIENSSLKKIILENKIRVFQLKERILHIFNKSIGEELVIIARK